MTTQPKHDDDEEIAGDETENHHSLPEPTERKDTNSLMQTIAGVAGNILEWYDFAIFGYFADTIGDVFFPAQKGNLATAESFAIFGAAFVMRPIGGMMMGYIGDTYGRKKALELSIFLMAFPTFAMGLLPSYEVAGLLAPTLLLIIRLLQGLSVGGQMMSSLIFTVESRPMRQWGYYGSFVMAAANIGTLLGGVIGNLITSSLTDEQVKSFGWRIPFLMGILVSLSGLYLKFYCEEAELHAHVPEGSTPENPIILAFRKENRRALLSATFVPMLWSGGFYLSFVWMVIYMKDLSNNPIDSAFTVNNIALLLSVVLLFPPAGILSDKFGRIPIMSIGGVCMLFSPFFVHTIGLGDPFSAFVSQVCLGIFLSLWCSPMMAWLAESFKPELRLTAVSIGYNIAQALIGGSFPFIATLMTGSRLGNASPGYLLTGAALLGLIGLSIAPPKPKYDEEIKIHSPVPISNEEMHLGHRNGYKTFLSEVGP